MNGEKPSSAQVRWIEAVRTPSGELAVQLIVEAENQDEIHAFQDELMRGTSEQVTAKIQSLLNKSGNVEIR